MKNNNKLKKYTNKILCFVAYKDKEELKKEQNFFKLNNEIKKSKKIKQEDINKIIKLLKDYTIIEPEILGEFMEYPIKDEKILKRYFDFYSNYYTNIIPDEIVGKILKIYNRYDYDLSNKFNEWFNYWDNKAITKDLGCLNIKGKKIFELQKRDNWIYKFKDLIKIKKYLEEELCLINRLDFYKNNFKNTIISDLNIINHSIKLKKEGWIITGKFFKL